MLSIIRSYYICRVDRFAPLRAMDNDLARQNVCIATHEVIRILLRTILPHAQLHTRITIKRRREIFASFFHARRTMAIITARTFSPMINAGGGRERRRVCLHVYVHVWAHVCAGNRIFTANLRVPLPCMASQASKILPASHIGR